MEQTSKISEMVKLPNSKGGKKNFQYVWKLLLIGISVLVLTLTNKIYLFHTRSQFQALKKGDIWTLTKIGISFAFLYTALDLLLHYLLDNWVEQNYLRTDKYTDPVSRQRRSYTIVKWGFGIIYYTFTSVIAYILVKQTSFMPRWLGGKGSVFSLIENRYLEEATWGMQLYYCIQFGKHLSRFFWHAFVRAEGSYFEYLLHHTLATFLIVFSYMMDMWTIGLFVLFVHDTSDIFLALGRSYKEYRHRNENILNVFYVLGFLAWVGFRVVIFSYCCVYSTWYCLIVQTHVLNSAQREVLIVPYAFMALMLSCLQIMHIYWTYYIVESFIAISVSAKAASHTYD